MTIVALVLVALLFGAVVLPAISRGGYGELAGVVVVLLAILVAERWLRTR
jgi:hypothetical protein